MRDDETLDEYIERLEKEDEALGVAVFVFCFFAVSGLISLVLLAAR